MVDIKFPEELRLDQYKKVDIKLSQDSLNEEQKEQITKNINIIRDSIIFFTGIASAKGLGGHTGGPYDVVPEAVLLDSISGSDKSIYPVLFDEAGHRVALQYIFAVIRGYMNKDKLLHYREAYEGLYGHPEREDEKGIFFSSGRLGHLWSYVNGIASANPDKKIILLGSDGCQQEGGDAEAARYAVSKRLNIKVFVDDNNVTIAGHPEEYMKGYDVGKTLNGHGVGVSECNGENIDELFQSIKKSFGNVGPYSVISKRKMAPGISGIEGESKGHDIIPVDNAIEYLTSKGYNESVEIIKNIEKISDSYEYKGSTKEKHKNRSEFGKIIASILKKMNEKERKEKVLVVDSDLEGSCGLSPIKKEYPEIFSKGGIMERNNFSVAAGFGSDSERQGIIGTFSAFLEMVISEITMARLNHSNVLCHFSHAGVDYMADNTCHFGINNLFADNGIEEGDDTRLYFPADVNQMKAMLNKIFYDKGLRFVFSTRSGVPNLLNENGNELYEEDYKFMSGKDDIVRDGDKVFIVSYGDMVFRCLDAVERLKEEGINIGLVNKSTLNVVDEEMMKKLCNADNVIFVESQNKKTGLGIRFGTWLLERGFKGEYEHIGVTKIGIGGLGEQMKHQGLDPESIMKKIKDMEDN